MDPITSAILSAVSAGVAGKTGEFVFTSAYESLKIAIKKKFGEKSKVIEAVTTLENEPDFEPNQAALAGRIEQAKASEDIELLKHARALIHALSASAEGQVALAKYQVSIKNSQVGVIGDNVHIEGGIHLGNK